MKEEYSVHIIFKNNRELKLNIESGQIEDFMLSLEERKRFMNKGGERGIWINPLQIMYVYVSCVGIEIEK